MGLLSSIVSAFTESKPDVPDFRLVDLVDQQMKTAEGNLGVMPQSEKLASGVNTFLRGERAKTLSGIPGLEDIESGVVGNLKNWLAGNLGSDFASNVMRGSNAKAYAMGLGGGMKSNLVVRDILRSGLDLQQSAMPLAQNYLGNEYRMRAVPEFDPASMFLSPQFASQFQSQQNQGQFSRDWLANRIAAQPEPWQSSLMTGLDQLESAAETGAAGYFGNQLGSRRPPTTGSFSAGTLF